MGRVAARRRATPAGARLRPARRPSARGRRRRPRRSCSVDPPTSTATPSPPAAAPPRSTETPVRTSSVVARRRHGASMPPSTWKKVPVDRHRSHEADEGRRHLLQAGEERPLEVRAHDPVARPARPSPPARPPPARHRDRGRRGGHRPGGRGAWPCRRRTGPCRAGPSNREPSDAGDRVGRRHRPSRRGAGRPRRAAPSATAGAATPARRRGRACPGRSWRATRRRCRPSDPSPWWALWVRPPPESLPCSSTVTSWPALPQAMGGGQAGRPGPDDGHRAAPVRCASPRRLRLDPADEVEDLAPVGPSRSRAPLPGSRGA